MRIANAIVTRNNIIAALRHTFSVHTHTAALNRPLQLIAVQKIFDRVLSQGDGSGWHVRVRQLCCYTNYIQ